MIFLTRNILDVDRIAEQPELNGFDKKRLRRMQCLCRLQKASVLIYIQRLDEAQTIWEDARDNFGGYPEVAAVGIRLNKARQSGNK